MHAYFKVTLITLTGFSPVRGSKMFRTPARFKLMMRLEPVHVFPIWWFSTPLPACQLVVGLAVSISPMKPKFNLMWFGQAHRNVHNLMVQSPEEVTMDLLSGDHAAPNWRIVYNASLTVCFIQTWKRLTIVPVWAVLPSTSSLITSPDVPSHKITRWSALPDTKWLPEGAYASVCTKFVWDLSA